MYRLLVVDDEEIITDGLYEVFKKLLPEKLDVCRAYSGKEALAWMSRTRIDIILTDIRMPGMSGLELTEKIQTLWPRCRIIFLTGHSEFNYVYTAIQMSNVRYLLKRDGYDKVTSTVEEIIAEIELSNQMTEWLEQSREQMKVMEVMAQAEYLRQLLQDGCLSEGSTEALERDFRQMNIRLDPGAPVVLALGRISFPSEAGFTEKNEIINRVRFIWDSFMAEKTANLGITDKQGDLLWFLQPLSDSDDSAAQHLILYLEGTLELIQETCLQSLGVNVSFTISGTACDWSAIKQQNERLRQLQQLKVGDGILMILKDRSELAEIGSVKEGIVLGHSISNLESHLEAGRQKEFRKDLELLTLSVLKGESYIQSAVEAYYSVALVLFTNINRLGMQGHLQEYGKLMRLDDHASMKEAFQFLQESADIFFQFKLMEDCSRTTHVIDRICNYIEENLGGDITLVHLAEVHYFNPSYLSRLFKQERGINLSEYIEKCRIKRSKELLQDSDLKVRDVALLVGYDAAHSFTRFFKKVAGITPQEYRDTVL